MGANKNLEIIKQLFDCSPLFDVMTNYSEVCLAYNQIVKSEIVYRDLSITYKDALIDAVRSSLWVTSRGRLLDNEYEYFKDGIARIRNHILGRKFNGEIAGAYASRVLYLSSSILAGADTCLKIKDISDSLRQKIELPKPKSFSYLRIVDPIAYGYVFEASKILSEIKII